MGIKIDQNIDTAIPAERTMTDRQNGNYRIQKTNDAGAVYSGDTNDLFIEKAADHAQNVYQDDKSGDGPDAECMKQMKDLANTVTDDDVSKLEEQGVDPEDESLDVIVTVVDKIQTQLATYCDDFEPTVTDLSNEQIEEIAGTSENAVHIVDKLKEKQLPVTEDNVKSMKTAMEMADGMSELTDSAKVYLLQNNLELTIENLYTAEYSSQTGNARYVQAQGYYEDGVSGYYSKRANEDTFDNLQGQMQQVVEQADLDVNDKSMGQAQWLLEHQLPLTTDNLKKLNAIQELDGKANPDKLMNNMAQMIKEGKSPSSASMVETQDLIERAQHAVDVILNTTDEDIKSVLDTQSDVTIEALAGVQSNQINTNQVENSEKSTEASEVKVEDINSNSTVSDVVNNKDAAYITAKRQLEEIRLQMTLEASATMIKQGISIETEDLQQLVEDLRNIEDTYYKNILTAGNIEPTDHNTELFREITESVRNIASSPAEVLGIVAFDETKQTIAAISEAGTESGNKYKQAEQAYETVMTKPRGDMGDSIQKAFRNVDEILEDMNLDQTTENQRAVRILGYNGMEITEENLLKVKSVDTSVNQLIKSMTPSNVLNMIKEGYNPLHENVSDVNNKINEMQDSTADTTEKYSEFLYKLEQNDQISEDERNAYIGIYRLLHQVEKSDGAVVGALVMQGADITLSNLMTGVRNSRHSAMDYTIDDTTGSVESKEGYNSITDQIESGYAGLQQTTDYYQTLITNALEDMSPQSLADLMNDNDVMNMNLEQFAEVAAAKNDQENRSYNDEKLNRMQELLQSDEDVVNYLTDRGQKVSLNYMAAAQQLLASPAQMFEKLRKQADKDADLYHAFQSSTDELEDGMTDKESMQNSYQDLVNAADTIVESGIEEQTLTYADMQGWKLLHSQISLAGNLAKQEEYYVPMELNGEMTAVHVSFQHNNSEQKVSVATEVEKLGSLSAAFTVTQEGVDGYFTSDSLEGKQMLQQMQESFSEQLQTSSGLSLNKSSFAEFNHIDQKTLYPKTDKEDTSQGSQATTGQLYQIAKSFLSVLKSEFAQ